MSQPDPSPASSSIAPARARNWITPVTILFGFYAIFRTAFSIYSLSRDSIFGHDLYVQYEPWLLLIHRNTTAEALQTLTYLPHTWVLLTPLYALGWHAAETLWFVINSFLHLYIWYTVSSLVGLCRDQRLLFLALYFSVLSVGVSIALGNPVTACMAATVAAYASANAGRSGIFFALASIKHSIIYPVYLKLVLQRSGKILPAPFVQLVVWVLWAVLFGMSLALIKNRIAQLAALLLIGLLPLHHRSYDLIVATPLVALLIKQESLLDPCLITLTLCGLWDTFCNHFQRHHPFIAACNQVYYPLLIGRRPQSPPERDDAAVNPQT